MYKSLMIGIDQPGGVEQFKRKEQIIDAPAEGEVILRQQAIGLNYIDIYHRTGLYPLPMPAVIGMEGAGEILEVGRGVTDVAIGDRVAYAGVLGGYASIRKMPANRLVKLPPSLDYETAAAVMLRGMTVEYLLCRTYQVKAGDWVLLHAAAGGVGLLASQWLKQIGANVIGVVGDEAKAALAISHGCDHVIIGRDANIPLKVKEFTNGKMVKVSYDSVGKSSFMASLDSLAPRGMLVSFGNASGPVPPFDPALLAARGSLFFTRPSLMAYIATREELVASAVALFAKLAGGLVVDIGSRIPLTEVGYAHRQLEARKTTGQSLLIPPTV